MLACESNIARPVTEELRVQLHETRSVPVLHASRCDFRKIPAGETGPQSPAEIRIAAGVERHVKPTHRKGVMAAERETCGLHKGALPLSQCERLRKQPRARRVPLHPSGLPRRLHNTRTGHENTDLLQRLHQRNDEAALCHTIRIDENHDVTTSFLKTPLTRGIRAWLWRRDKAHS